MNKKKLNINLVHHLCLNLDHGYPWKQLDHKKIFKNESIEDMK
jgi:hypothetical protein